MTAKSRFITANRLRQHLLEWGEGQRVVLLLHGYLEHAHTWDLVAPRLVQAGYRAFALDWRGHGDSEWIGAGGYYHFADYAADLGFLIRQLGGRAAVVAHSMGATAAMLYAGTEPERVTALALIDGVGPPDLADPDAQPSRWAAWIADLERATERDPRTMTLDEAKSRLRERFPRFSPNVTRLMAEHGTRARSGQRTWKFDPMHQTRSPVGYSRAAGLAFAARVTAPVLFVEGSESPVRLDADDLEARLVALRATRAVIADSGHHPHLEQPDALADTLIAFLDEHDA